MTIIIQHLKNGGNMKIKTTSLRICTTLLLVFGIYGGMASAFGQSEPPTAAYASFNQQFPNAKKVKWEVLSNNLRASCVEFVEHKKRHRAYFDKDGRLLELQKEVEVDELPEKVRMALSRIYPGERVVKAYEVVKAGKSLYQVELDIESHRTRLTVNTEGMFTSR
jgi:hypothetical protein